MFYREILRIIGLYLLLYATILLLPLLLAGYYQFIALPEMHPQPHATSAFFYTLIICLLLAGVCLSFARSAKKVLYRKEALFTMVAIWFLTPLIGALPFLLNGTLSRFDQAYLEATSSFSTAGASVLEAKKYDPETGVEMPWLKTYCDSNPIKYTYYGTITPITDPYTGKKLEGLNAVSRAILFWRSFSQWLGGIGIIVLFVAFLPTLGIGGKFLFQLEVSSHLKEGLTPRIQETALKLCEIYVGLTFAQIMALLLTNKNMALFDATTLAFSTISNGGLSIHNENLAFYHQTWTEWVVVLFMWLGSLNFSLYYFILKGHLKRLYQPELILYLAILVGFGLFVSWKLVGVKHFSLTNEDLGHYDVSSALKQGFFQVISTQTSTGFYITNYDTWPSIIKVLLLISAFIGGMSGSTAGGIKIIRLQLLFQIVKNKIESIFMPQTVKILRVGQKEIDQTTMLSTLCYLLIAIVACVVATFIYMLDHLDTESAFTLAISMISNAGLGFQIHGPTGSLAFLSPFSAYFSSFLMILGRLEFYVVLAILLPIFWRTRA